MKRARPEETPPPVVPFSGCDIDAAALTRVLAWLTAHDLCIATRDDFAGHRKGNHDHIVKPVLPRDRYGKRVKWLWCDRCSLHCECCGAAITESSGVVDAMPHHTLCHECWERGRCTHRFPYYCSHCERGCYELQYLEDTDQYHVQRCDQCIDDTCTCGGGDDD